jgi:hypothetical protein
VIGLLDGLGGPLAHAGVNLAGDGRTLRLWQVQGKKALLHYYCAGERQVLVDVGGVRFPGCLGTRWQRARRLWFVTLAQPQPDGSRQCRGWEDSSSMATVGSESGCGHRGPP